MRSLSLQLSKKTYWHLDELAGIFLVMQLIVIAILSVPLALSLIGYSMADTIIAAEERLGIETVSYIIDLITFTMIVGLLGTVSTIMIKSIGGRCSECKHQLDRHEDRHGRIKGTGCKGKRPKKNTIFTTEACPCTTFTQVKGINSKDFIDEDTGVVVTRKDKWLVLAVWLLVVFGWRFLVLEIDPYKWLGSLGAIGLSFATIYLSFRYVKQLYKYKLKFNAVMKRWYSRRIQYMLFLYLAYNILMTLLIQYGHDHYDRYIIAFKALEENKGLERYPVENGKLEYVYLNTTFSELYLDNSSPAVFWHSMSYFMAQTDFYWGGFLGTANWVFIYEEAEFIIFFVMIRKGWLFK